MTAPGPGGGYLTRGRALELERQLAATEARFQARVDQLERELADLRASQLDVFRAMVGGLTETLRRQLDPERRRTP